MHILCYVTLLIRVAIIVVYVLSTQYSVLSLEVSWLVSRLV
jgi:hypothetical protein